MAGPAGIALLCGCVVNSRITPLWQVQQALLCSVGVLLTQGSLPCGRSSRHCFALWVCCSPDITPLRQVQQALLCSVGVLFTRYNSLVAGPAGIALLCGCVVHQV